MSNTAASITSPNYPNFYPSNTQCYYYIRAPSSYRIILQFSDFNLPSSNQNSCDDSVEIRYYNLGIEINYLFYFFISMNFLFRIFF